MTRRVVVVYGSLLLLIATAAPTGAADRSPVHNGRIFFSSASQFQELLTALNGVDSDIFSVRANGTGLQQITSGRQVDSSPESSPDGTAVAFDRSYGCICRIGLVDALLTAGGDIFVIGDSGEQNLTNSPEVSDRGPDWSPDGSQIAFARDRYEVTAEFDLYVMDVASGGMRLIAQGSGDQWDPSWSPDGSWIVYADPATRSLRIVRPDGTRNAVLVRFAERPVQTADLRPPQAPDWGPHDKIAFEFAGDIWVINADGSGLKRLTSEDAWNDFGPAWSPDGRKIVFVSNRDGDNRLYIMDADGRHVTEVVLGISLSGAPIYSPSWAPR